MVSYLIMQQRAGNRLILSGGIGIWISFSFKPSRFLRLRSVRADEQTLSVSREAGHVGSGEPTLPLTRSCSAFCYFSLVNHHPAGLVIGQRSGMIKRAGMHPNPSDWRRRPPRFFDCAGE
jgi:hypothetical protein